MKYVLILLVIPTALAGIHLIGELLTKRVSYRRWWDHPPEPHHSCFSTPRWEHRAHNYEPTQRYVP